RNKLLHTKGLFDAGCTGFAQGSHRFFVGDITGNENQLSGEFGTMDRHPGMYLRAIDTSRGAHVGDDAHEIAASQELQCVSARIGGHHLISIALQSGAHIRHDCGLIFNQKDRRGGRTSTSLRHFGLTPATAPNEALSIASGKRTMKVAPSESKLLLQTIFTPLS